MMQKGVNSRYRSALKNDAVCLIKRDTAGAVKTNAVVRQKLTWIMHEAISSSMEVEKMVSERQNQKILPKIDTLPPYPRRDDESGTLQNVSIKVGESNHRLFPVGMHIPSEANRDAAFCHLEESGDVN